MLLESVVFFLVPGLLTGLSLWLYLRYRSEKPLRRYYGQILQDLPTAVCTIDSRDRVLTWNKSMSAVTGLPAEATVGSPVESLKGWGSLLGSFARDAGNATTRTRLQVEGKVMSLNLHKATVGAGNGDVIIVIEDITEAESLEQQLLDKERLASIGQLAAGVAHEIGNPVTGISCIAQDLKMAMDRDDLKLLPDQILEQTERISTIVQSLVNFAHQGNKEQTSTVPIDMKQCIDEAIRLLSLSHRSDKVTYINHCPSGLTVAGNPQRLSQVFVNILSNARDASKEGDEITVNATTGDGLVTVEIIDQGHGIPADHLHHIFEPFYTTKDPGRGTGLGLAIVNSIIEEHQGSITVDSKAEPCGTRFTIQLPAAADEHSELTSAPDSLLSARVLE